MLLKVLYKQLNLLQEQSYVTLDQTQHGALTFDKLLDVIKEGAKFGEDGSAIIMTCQIMKKALRGLGLVVLKKMNEDEKHYIKLIQNKILQKFSQAFRDTIKQAYYNDVITQDLKLKNFDNDLKRFTDRSNGLRESFQKVIAQKQIAKVSAHDVSLCLFQNSKDDLPNLRGIYLTKSCPNC